MDVLPKVSIVIINYNGSRYLSRTLPVFLQLDYPSYEVIVVDNGSSDDSVQLVKNFPAVRLICNPENVGYARAKNIGAREARGEYLLLTDNDIYSQDPEILKKLVAFHQAKGPCLSTTVMLNSGATTTSLYGGYYGFYGIRERRAVALDKILHFPGDIPISCPHGASLFCAKAVWKKLGGYDESQPFILDDIDLGPRAWNQDIPVYLQHGTYFTHLGIEGRTQTKLFCWKYQFSFSGLSRMMIKNYNFFNLLRVYPFFVVYMLLKTLKNFVFRRDWCVLRSFLFSLQLFFQHLPDTLRERKRLQALRVNHRDVFLHLRQPHFNDYGKS